MFIAFFVCNELLAQEKSVFGSVKDIKTNVGLANLNVLNARTNQVVVTNDTGEFYMRAIAGDSIIISSFGYNRKGIKWDAVNKNPIILTKQDAIMLQEVVVTEKKYEDLHGEIQYFLDNPYDSKAIKNETIKNLLNNNTSMPGIGISIDAIYDLYSKEGKARRKLADWRYNDAKKLYAELRYNKQVVSQVTRLENDDLDDFMGFCKPTQDFILRATDYELTFRILKCMNDFRSTRIFRQLK